MDNGLPTRRDREAAVSVSARVAIAAPHFARAYDAFSGFAARRDRQLRHTLRGACMKGRRNSAGSPPYTQAVRTSQTCDILPWRFKTYVSPSSRHDVQNDLDRMDDYGQAYFQRQVVYLASTARREDWSEPHALTLSGYVDLYEIRFKHPHKATRALGFFGPEPGVFTITLVATHKQNVYTPRDALATASNRRKAICDGIAAAVPLQCDGEDFPPLPE